MRLGAAKAAGLHTDQGPPLLVPTAFFGVAPLAFVAAGVALILGPSLPSRWAPGAMAATHMGTLGLLGSIMIGALYQMLPVLAGAPVPMPRLGHGVLLSWLVGTSALVIGLFSGSAEAFSIASLALGAALVLLIIPMGVALSRTSCRVGGLHRVEIHGLRAALSSLAWVGGYGLYMAWGWRSGRVPANLQSLLAAHLTVGLLGWIGVLLTAISTQIIPMFYLTAAFPRRASLLALGLVVGAVGLAGALPMLAPLFAEVLRVSPRLIAMIASPGAVVIWLIHPLYTLHLLRNRRRRRVDLSVRFWQVGLSVAPLVLLAGLMSFCSDSAPWPLLFGWLAIFGWAGLILHGMLTRILPFLLWFHWFAAKAGFEPVPPMRHLFPARHARPCLALHTVAVALGAVGILLNRHWLLQVAGLCLAGTGLALGYAMIAMAPMGRRPGA